MKQDETITTLHAQYTCNFHPAAEGGYSVRCPAFPGLITEGDTLEDARHNAREALELCIESYLAQGWPLPPSEDSPTRSFKEVVPVRLARV